MDRPVLRGDGQEYVLTIGSFLTLLINFVRQRRRIRSIEPLIPVKLLNIPFD